MLNRDKYLVTSPFIGKIQETVVETVFGERYSNVFLSSAVLRGITRV